MVASCKFLKRWHQCARNLYEFPVSLQSSADSVIQYNCISRRQASIRKLGFHTSSCLEEIYGLYSRIRTAI
jgi:hypothetical protein